MIERKVRVIPQKEEEYFVVDGKEFDTEDQAQHYVKLGRQDAAFKMVLKDSAGYWPQNTTMRGYGEETVFASSTSIKNWLVKNESTVMCFYKTIGEST